MGIGTTSPNASARPQVDANPSTNAKGFLSPRSTATERGAITAPTTGLVVYQTDGTSGLYHYNGTTILANPAAGTYTFSLQMQREDETCTIIPFKNWGIFGTGQVFLR